VNRRGLFAAAAAFAALPPRWAVAAPRIEMMSPEESIALEHQTRSIRLRRLVRELEITPPPEFFEYRVPRRVMPADFRYDTPVLRVVFPENTFFDTARWDVVSSAQPIVAAMAKMLQGDVPDVALFVAGHTDSRGSEAYNHNLSIQRARAVANALRAAGADGPDIWSVGFGESLPLYGNDSDDHMAYNRRVEFLFGARVEAVADWLKDQMDLACSDAPGADRLRCLSTLTTLSNTYVVEPVAHLTHLSAPNHTTGLSTQSTVVAPPRRQIVINLRERTYIVKHPEG
jgi:outer membrane protein OmpA-like peptidoglycan-associated protein